MAYLYCTAPGIAIKAVGAENPSTDQENYPTHAYIWLVGLCAGP